ncbi:hypothetical protein ACFQ3K_14695 [Brucella gallinifaecis]|uniref:Uncharacterized protein n=1 Tax=Brucella gallinifaecis TaxID=215590 RepID=A0A502BQ91_9HYPH|nr:hypothetical protein [Brucella gallinifaecis]TPF76712.1 hypothetical protein FHY56_04255 [Brucella gallinifaecis]
MNAGHNSKLTQGEYDALLMDCARKESIHLARIAALQADRKADRKIFQSYGYTLHEVDTVVKGMNAEDKDKVAEKHRRQANALSLLGIVKKQGDLFEDERDYLDKVFDDGKIAGLKALDRVSGFMAGTDEDQAWLRGYDAGQEEQRKNLVSAMEKINSASDEDHGDPDFPDAEAA